VGLTAYRRTVLDRFKRTVRCSKGHVFTATWVPYASLTSIRLWRARYMRCPVGNHWAICRPVDAADLATTTPD
jgi:hypothetical protein